MMFIVRNLWLNNVKHDVEVSYNLKKRYLAKGHISKFRHDISTNLIEMIYNILSKLRCYYTSD